MSEVKIAKTLNISRRMVKDILAEKPKDAVLAVENKRDQWKLSWEHEEFLVSSETLLK